MEDHHIAHRVHQQILEKRHIKTVAEVAAFFEEEELTTEDYMLKTRCLTKAEVDRLPQSFYKIEGKKNLNKLNGQAMTLEDSF